MKYIKYQASSVNAGKDKDSKKFQKNAKVQDKTVKMHSTNLKNGKKDEE